MSVSVDIHVKRKNNVYPIKLERKIKAIETRVKKLADKVEGGKWN